MPANAANRMTIPVSAGKVLRFGISEGRKTGATAEIRNTMSNTDLTIRAQRAQVMLKKFYDWAGTPDGGTFKLKFGGVETAAIAYNATAAVVKAALDAIAPLATYTVEVVGTAAGTGYTITLMPKPSTGTFGGTKSFIHPLDQSVTKQNLTVSTNAVTVSSVVQAVVETDQTWVNTDPDGHNAAIVVKPYGVKQVAWGQGADENNADNTLGPFFRFSITTGEGLMEFSPSDSTLNVFRI